jgi:hypothetical protein
MFRCNHHHQGAHYMSLLKLQCEKSQLEYIGVFNLVVWLHMQPHYEIKHTNVF